MEKNIPETMNISLLNKPFDMEMKEVKVPKIGATDVLVKVMAVGVCGSDVHYYEHGRVGEFVVEKPLILGHECSGVVTDIGSNVTRFKVGDRVAIEPGVPCGECEYCKSGKYNLCPDVEFLATPPVDGALSQYISHPEGFLFHIPEALSYEEATLNEPFSVGVQACKRANVQPGSTVVIMGMGPVGLMAVVAAKAFGATKIIVSDLEKIRLDEALKLGATHAINIKEEGVATRINEITKGKGVNYAFETAGNPIALQNALAALNNGGTLAIVGLPQQENIELNIPFIANHEINIVGIFRYANTYDMGLEMLASTSADLNTMFTDAYDLNEAKEAMEQARTNKSGSLKVMVYPNGKPE
ncbi:L-iditol 2-dehydrogenase [Staphylococcus saprophyticus]|uniref:NAD(P)-dependent alcohol dehydrogenase n=1 Tax=Staphylococcus saprophyticus TaxID=29385 RepID=UPI0008531890|nr:NAD(P)-dependent alcohol dehydrogenase [Staphylococcus saprophyticus]MBN6850702.1 NAD(P)-dependent alcohol dehydrogenase [Staphylococcus saprophyticus]MBU8680629.1 NAD(P)-dependent alcohol dehydrogenase [Staphylococcus saprophyticus]MDW3802207.1 NAD(P)-dependent alcohol dehydrogenase [Staphylococcus saprophyticus]MDW3892396.1 NAD(P)-dependent alcohol dehydrogenase [Staphylococcus saprophyticus]MDW3919544.1 NAD(P)-dependent alcohol dehydrogenase [Staphylococcus saprophyticus]